MPRHTHPPPRVKHDRAMVRHHAERVTAKRWRELKDRYGFRWALDYGSAHPESARALGELDREAYRLAEAWEERVSWTITNPDAHNVIAKPYPKMWSWHVLRDMPYLWPFDIHRGILATRNTMACGNVHCSCCSRDYALARHENRRVRYGRKPSPEHPWRLEVWD